MEPAEIIADQFWNDSSPVDAAGEELPCLPGLENQVLFRTSGSSGAAKWVALSKSSLIVSATAVNRHLNVSANDCWGLALPLRHVGGFGVAARAFAAGCRLACFNARWQAASFAAWIDHNCVSHTSLVPTQVHDLVAAKLHAPDCLRVVVVGGGRLVESTGRAARALGWPVIASYGMTEAASQIATQSLESLNDVYRSAPLPLLPIWDAKLSNDKRLMIAGNALFSGVLAARDGELRYFPRDGQWHVTEDLVKISDDQLTPLGRADATVKVLGELVNPEDVESALMLLAGGRLDPASMVVVALPDLRSDHVLVPVFDAAVDPVMAENLAHCHSSAVPGPWRLARPIFLEAFPRGALGKPMRAEIATAVMNAKPHKNRSF